MKRGEKKCRFSHRITQNERNDENFISLQRKEKDEKASKCINEFRGKDRCWRKELCPFSHNINEEDRNNDSLVKTMDERETMIIKKKRKSENVANANEASIENPAEFMKDMLTLKKEFMKMMEMMKTSMHP